MSRIRTIKPEWCDSEHLAAMSDAARVMSVGLITLADDYGNGRGNLLYLASRIWPYEEDHSVLVEKASGALQELSGESPEKIREFPGNGAEPFARLYRVGGQQYFHITGWERHQRINKPGKPRVPGPEKAEENHPKVTDSGNPPKKSGNSRVSLPTDHDLDLDLDPDLDHEHDREGESEGEPSAAPPHGGSPVAADVDPSVFGDDEDCLYFESGTVSPEATCTVSDIRLSTDCERCRWSLDRLAAVDAKSTHHVDRSDFQNGNNSALFAHSELCATEQLLADLPADRVIERVGLESKAAELRALLRQPPPSDLEIPESCPECGFDQIAKTVESGWFCWKCRATNIPGGAPDWCSVCGRDMSYLGNGLWSCTGENELKPNGDLACCAQWRAPDTSPPPFDFKAAMRQGWESARKLSEEAGEDFEAMVAEAGENIHAPPATEKPFPSVAQMADGMQLSCESAAFHISGDAGSTPDGGTNHPPSPTEGSVTSSELSAGPCGVGEGGATVVLPNQPPAAQDAAQKPENQGDVGAAPASTFTGDEPKEKRCPQLDTGLITEPEGDLCKTPNGKPLSSFQKQNPTPSHCGSAKRMRSPGGKATAKPVLSSPVSITSPYQTTPPKIPSSGPTPTKSDASAESEGLTPRRGSSSQAPDMLLGTDAPKTEGVPGRSSTTSASAAAGSTTPEYDQLFPYRKEVSECLAKKESEMSGKSATCSGSTSTESPPTFGGQKSSTAGKRKPKPKKPSKTDPRIDELWEFYLATHKKSPNRWKLNRERRALIAKFLASHNEQMVREAIQGILLSEHMVDGGWTAPENIFRKRAFEVHADRWADREKAKRHTPEHYRVGKGHEVTPIRRVG